MDVSPIKRSSSRKLSIIYMLFLSGVCFLSATHLLFSEKNSSSNAAAPFFFHKSMSLPNINNNNADSDTLYIITPTYTRYEQEAELTRLGQTLMLVKNMVWIVVEDNKLVTDRLKHILSKFTSINIVLIAAPMPVEFRMSRATSRPRGVAGRNAGMRWILENVSGDGVMYFADDDNTYDLRLFEEIQLTKRVSFFPVGLVGKLGISAPIVKNGKIVGFFDDWKGNRLFSVDMAGFAINLKTLRNAWNRNGYLEMPYKVSYEEDGFLRQIGISPEEGEPLADNCTKTLVWHTKTYFTPIETEDEDFLDREGLLDTNIPKIFPLS